MNCKKLFHWVLFYLAKFKVFLQSRVAYRVPGWFLRSRKYVSAIVALKMETTLLKLINNSSSLSKRNHCLDDVWISELNEHKFLRCKFFVFSFRTMGHRDYKKDRQSFGSGKKTWFTTSLKSKTLSLDMAKRQTPINGQKLSHCQLFLSISVLLWCNCESGKWKTLRGSIARPFSTTSKSYICPSFWSLLSLWYVLGKYRKAVNLS